MRPSIYAVRGFLPQFRQRHRSVEAEWRGPSLRRFLGLKEPPGFLAGKLSKNAEMAMEDDYGMIDGSSTMACANSRGAGGTV